MIIQLGKLKLTRLQEKDIEMVRKWRNCREIGQYMEYREHITPEMQARWFKSVDNIYNLYFLMHYEGKTIGLCNVKNIEWDNEIMEAGVFIWDIKQRNTPIPVIGFLIMAELVIVKMGLRAQAHILKTNKRAINFNTSLGFELCENQEEVENQLYMLNRKSYLEKAGKLRKLLSMVREDGRSEIIIEKEDYKTEFGSVMEEKFRKVLGNPVTTARGKVFDF